jgi:pheromone shutdown protein TraB
MAAPTDDPRIHDDYVEVLPGDSGADGPADARTEGRSGDVILVGVVHDHPASVHRVRSLIGSYDPATVALELSSVALPLFEEYADCDGPSDERNDAPPELGGEMSAAIRAADCDVVGVDAPNAAFFARLAARFREERPDLRTVYSVLRGVVSVTRHALTCRLGASVARLTGRTLELDRPVDHDCTRRDPPAEQASDEKRQASQSLSLLRAFETPEPMHLRDSTREECMAAKLADLRTEGDVLAVVGIDHLDGVAAELDG